MTELELRFLYSLTCCEHSGDVFDAVVAYIKKQGLPIESQDLADVREWLEARGVTRGIYAKCAREET